MHACEQAELMHEQRFRTCRAGVRAELGLGLRGVPSMMDCKYAHVCCIHTKITGKRRCCACARARACVVHVLVVCVEICACV